MLVRQPLRASALSLLTIGLTLLAAPSLGLPQQQNREVPEFSSNREAAASLPLSPGDLVRILIPGTGGEEFSGNYEVNLEGNLEIPFLEPLPVAGLDAQQVIGKLRDILLARKFFRPELLRVNVQILHFSSILVAVKGETFEPGRVLINQVESKTNLRDSAEIALFPGDRPLERSLTVALKAAGGIKPTADISQIQVVRGTRSITVDISGIFTGKPIADIPLITGDQVIVPDSGNFNPELVRPSQITPANIPLYVSNLTAPGNGRALEAASRIGSTSFAYGTRVSQILIAAQCIGGSITTNDRSAVLVRTDRMTGETTVIEYSVKDLLRGSQAVSEDDQNRFLMPHDSIACYDSSVTNARDIFDTLSDILSPINLLRIIFR